MAEAVDVRDVARRAFDWIEDAAVPVDGGVAWSEFGAICDDLYAGTAGVLLACAEAHVAGLDLRGVGGAARDRLLQLVEQDAGLPDDGLFTGWAGVALALRGWSKAASDPVAAAAAATVSGRIAARITGSVPARGRYLDVVLGDAGILLGLLGDPDSDAALTVLADGLVERVQTAAGRIHWPMIAGHADLMPGFSHGTAGVAYALIAAGRRLHRDDLVALGVRAAADLMDLGWSSEGWALPVQLPRYPNRPPVNYGWCHGACGTVRLFLAVDAVEARPGWCAAVDACLEAIRASGLPTRRYPGFWDNLSCCCGTAGVGRLLLDRYEATGNRPQLRHAAALAADVLARRQDDGGGVYWRNVEYTADPPELPPEAGFMQGTASIASWLARLSAVAAGERPARIDPHWL